MQINPQVKVLNAVAPDDAAAAVAGTVAGTAAAAADEDPIHTVLRTCGVTALASRMTFINVEGLDSISAFTQLSGNTEDATEMAKCMASRAIAAGRVILGTMQMIKRIQALIFWDKDHDKRDLVAEPELWDNKAMVEAMERKEAKRNYGKSDVGTIDPGKCQMDHDWDNWQIAFTNKLNATLGAAQVPIN